MFNSRILKINFFYPLYIIDEKNFYRKIHFYLFQQKCRERKNTLYMVCINKMVFIKRKQSHVNTKNKTEDFL